MTVLYPVQTHHIVAVLLIIAWITELCAKQRTPSLINRKLCWEEVEGREETHSIYLCACKSTENRQESISSLLVPSHNPLNR